MKHVFDESEGSSRREFLGKCLNSIAGITVIGIVAPLLIGCGDDSVVSLDQNYSGSFDVSSLVSDGQALVTSSKGADGFPVLIVRNSAGAYIALSTRCPHENCEVDAPSGGTIRCACHNSKFDLTGSVLQGPATTALYKYTTTYDASTRVLTVRTA